MRASDMNGWHHLSGEKGVPTFCLLSLSGAISLLSPSSSPASLAKVVDPGVLREPELIVKCSPACSCWGGVCRRLKVHSAWPSLHQLPCVVVACAREEKLSLYPVMYSIWRPAH